MADQKISAMTAATALQGDEVVPVLQSATNKRTTTQAIANLVAAEVIDDRVAALLVAGSGITITYNDTSGTLTLAATGGSSTATVAVVDSGQTGYDIVSANAGKAVRLSAATATTAYLYPNSAQAMDVGAVISVRQVGAGQVTVSPQGGVTLNIPTGLQAKTRGQHCTLMLHKVAADTWDLTGDLASV